MVFQPERCLASESSSVLQGFVINIYQSVHNLLPDFRQIRHIVHIILASEQKFCYFSKWDCNTSWLNLDADERLELHPFSPETD